MSGEERDKELKIELERIVRILEKRVRPEKIVLFGSLASGKVHPESDSDLLKKIS